MMMHETSSHQEAMDPVIHHGSWVVAGGPSHEKIWPGIIQDGALLVAGGLIRAIGKYRDIAKEFSQYHIREHEGMILAPPLINGHCHLELSYLDLANKGGSTVEYDGNITAWIRDLLKAREKFSHDEADSDEKVLAYARRVLQEMAAEGVAFVGDVGNSLASRSIGERQDTRVCFLLEILGLAKEAEIKAFARVESITTDPSLGVGCTPHAPYSTSPALIQAIKKLSLQHGRTFSMHVAESRHEVEFIQSGTGSFRDFLIDRGVWDNSFAAPGKRPVQFLESLGVIDDKTLCVHGVHVEEAEIAILARRKAKVCLCPGSNRFLGVGKAPVTEYLAHGILPALGTDSKASNRQLSMWREMCLLREDHPAIAPQTVFSMATRGGAEAWGIASEIGTLEPGKKALIQAIDCNGELHTDRQVFEYLTTAGTSIQTAWLEKTGTS